MQIMQCSLVVASLVGTVVPPPIEGSEAPKARYAFPSVQKAGPKQAGAASSVEQRVRDRISAYWKARMTMNLAACFPFYESAFRAKHTPESFARDFRRLNRFAPEFQGVEAVSFDAAGVRATVKVKLKTKVDALEGQELVAAVEEAWVLENGEWWKAAEPLLPQI